ncbi:trigger factor [Thermoleophilia bacterium SCSIO 60948]|nr:trigger factor [Thermoleophilia bacterium SCSIO 60948]
MKTELSDLPESRVRIEVEVPAEDLERQVTKAATALGREMRVPGFRPGKVPAPLVIQQLGRESVLDQALREAMPQWYEQAILEAEITPIGEPDLNVEELPEEGKGLSFSIEVGVRPTAEIGDYKGLEVPKADPTVPDEAIAAELDRLREGFASLNPVERPAQSGDAVVIDYAGTVEGEPFEGSTAQDFVVELGNEGLLAEFEQGLTGKAAGEDVEVEVDFPDDHQPEELAGKTANFEVTVKEVREKELPELDDDFAADASEFDTIDELRSDIEGKLRQGLDQRAESEFREAAVEAAAQAAEVEIPEAIAQARAEEMWERVEHQLGHRGISPEMYLQMQGKTRDELIDEARADAERALRREAALEAIADAEKIEPTEDELLEAIGPGDGKTKPEKILKQLRKSGRDQMLRDDVRLRKAADLVIAEAKPVAAPEPVLSDADEDDDADEAEPSEAEVIVEETDAGDEAEPMPDEEPSEAEVVVEETEETAPSRD